MQICNRAPVTDAETQIVWPASQSQEKNPAQNSSFVLYKTQFLGKKKSNAAEICMTQQKLLLALNPTSAPPPVH